MLNKDGSYTKVTLGDNPDEGHVLQYKVPAGTILVQQSIAKIAML